MGDQRKAVAVAALELADGAVVVRATEAAANLLGVPADELVGRTIRLVDDDDRRADGDVGGREMFDVFADLSALALFSQDSQGRIVRWNRGAELIFGYDEIEIVGNALTSIAPSHLRADLEVVEQRVAAGERIDRVFTEIHRKDGMPVPIALSVSPVIDSFGTYIGAMGVAQELTETRLAQAALAEVEQRFGEWEALAHVGRWLWDVGTDAVQWSDELHRMHGVDPLEFEGTLAAHLSVVHPHDRDRVRSLMEGAVAGNQAFEDEYRLADEGTTRWFAMRAEPAVGSSGDVVGLRGVTQAISVSAVQR
ncbi:MAG: PAS domain S-box protein [Ilumatobacteraceae bacterium]